MELRALRYFVTVAEELHFGRAAERLHIVQPAVSQQVARLERELGTRLIDRSTRHVRLTDSGARVLAAAREALAASDRVRVAAGRPPATLRVGAAPGLMDRLERGVAALRERNPELEVVLLDRSVPEQLAALRRDDLDVALVRGPVRGSGLRVSPAWTEPLLAVTSGERADPAHGRVMLAELAGGTLRMPGARCDPPLRELVLATLAAAGVSPRLGRPTGTVQNTLVELGSDPTGWALLPAGQVVGSTRVLARELDPPVRVAGSVVTAADLPEQCRDTLVAAFADPGSLPATGVRGDPAVVAVPAP